jgi:hypothetical protein
LLLPEIEPWMPYSLQPNLAPSKIMNFVYNTSLYVITADTETKHSELTERKHSPESNRYFNFLVKNQLK